MCWINPVLPLEQTATKDKHVLKILHKNLKSAYVNFKYEFDTLYSIDKLKIYTDSLFGQYIINEGFHSYSIQNTAILRDDFIFNPIIMIKSMYGSVLDQFQSEKYDIMECIIPKGAIFYENNRGEIVSNKIMIWKLY